MENDTETSEAARRYAAAYAAHYTRGDLPLALQLYQQVMASHPSMPQAGYAVMQIRNIVNAVVPKQELLDAQMELALAHLKHEPQPDARRASLAPVASEVLT